MMKQKSTNHPIIRIIALCIAAMALSVTIDGGVCLAEQKAAEKLYRDPALLMSGDVLDIMVYRQEDLNMPLRVGPDGGISFPFCGAVKAQGKTPRELENVIIGCLKAARFEEPQVVVFIKEYAPRKVYVFGVGGGDDKGGKFNKAIDITPGGTLSAIQAISAAGGVTGQSDLRNITIVRRDQAGKQHFIKLDASDAAMGGESTNDVLLMPNDTIIIPPLRKIYVYGRVMEPGGFMIPHGDKITVSRALALAGGSERPASESMLKLIRGKKVIDVDLSEMVDDGKVEADLEMQPGDVLYVPQSRW